MHNSYRPLLILASLALLLTSVTSYNNNAYSPYRTNYGDYGNRYSDSRNGYGNGYGRPDPEIVVPASQPSACPNDVVVTEGIIIDIRTSVALGALLLDGAMQQTFESCVSRCCSTTGCDMALFKQSGLSDSEKNCYLVKCGRPENCKMVQHDGFTCASVGSTSSTTTFGPGRENAGSIHPSPDGEDRPQFPMRPTLPPTRPAPPSTEGREQPLATVSKETVQTEGPSSSPTTATATTATTEVSTPSATTNEEPARSSDRPSDLDLTQESVTMPTAIDSGGSDSIATGPNLVPESDQTPTEATDGDEEETSESDDSSESTSGNNTNKDSGEAVNQDSQQRPVISKEKNSGSRDVCGESGCSGGGVIPVAVVGAISLVMLVVVVAIVLRRVVAIRRRRKFRNVDYLINGMYT